MSQLLLAYESLVAADSLDGLVHTRLVLLRQNVEEEQTLRVAYEPDVLGRLPVEQVAEVVAERGLLEHALATQMRQVVRIGERLHELELD